MGFYSDRIFPVLCDRATRPYDEQRETVFGLAAGRTLEVGIGAGKNLKFYSDKAREVVGLEYSEGMLAKAYLELQRLRQRAVLRSNVTLVSGSVTQLEFEDHSFDTVITFLVFCSISEPERAGREIFRVLKPGGKFLFFEHVLASEEGLAKWQRRLNPLWKKIACGCNLTRDTKAVFEEVGFRLEEFSEYVHEDSMRITAPKIQGVAVKP